MVNPDSERRFGQGPEAEQKARRVPIAELVLEGTIGDLLVSQIPDLGMRLRPETTFNQPLTSLWPKNSRKLKELQSRGMNIVADVLRLSEDEFSSFTNTDRIRDDIRHYLEGLAITSHARLLGAIFGGSQAPVPPDREWEIIKPVEEAVATLGENRNKEAILWRFGLRDGIFRTLEETGKRFIPPVTYERVRQVEAKALRKLRHLSRSKALRDLICLPEESFARQLFGAVFEKDLPNFGSHHSLGWMPGLELSDSTREELGKLRDQFPNDIDLGGPIDSLVKADLKKIRFSIRGREETARALQKAVDEYTRETLPTEATVFVRPKREEKPAEPPVNNLLPEIPLTGEQLVKVSEIPVRELKIPVRMYNALIRALSREGAGPKVTVGDILKLSRDGLPRIRNFGLKSAIDLGERLEELLGLPEEQYPKGFVKNLLISSFRPPLRPSGYMQEQWAILNKNEIDSIRQLTTSAMHEGLTLPEEIQKWIIGQYEEGKRTSRDIAGVNMRSWKLLAMIEYILHHPEEQEKER